MEMHSSTIHIYKSGGSRNVSGFECAEAIATDLYRRLDSIRLGPVDFVEHIGICRGILADFVDTVRRS